MKNKWVCLNCTVTSQVISHRVVSSSSLSLGILTLYLFTVCCKYLYLCALTLPFMISFQTADSQVRFCLVPLLSIVKTMSSSTTVKTSVNTKQPLIAWANTHSLFLSQAYRCINSSPDTFFLHLKTVYIWPLTHCSFSWTRLVGFSNDTVE